MAFKLVLGFGAQKRFGPKGPLCLSCMTTKTKWAISPITKTRPVIRESGCKLELITSLPLTCDVV